MLKIDILLVQMLNRIAYHPETCQGCPHHTPDCDKEHRMANCYFAHEVSYMHKALEDLNWGLSDET